MTSVNYYASDTWREYSDEVKRLSYGHWDIILSKLSPDLGRAIERYGKHVPCPRHGGTDGFRLFTDFRQRGSAICNTCGNFDDGFALLQWLYGWKFSDAIRNVGEVVGVVHPRDRARGVRDVPKVAPIAPAPRRSPEEVARQDAYRAQLLHKTWSESCELMAPGGEPARLYLKHRNITKAVGPLVDLRVHPGLPYYENEQAIAEYPALLALLRQPNGDPCTIQRIYLTPDGRKADVQAPKKVMSRRSTAIFNGSAVRLDHQVGSVLLASEGVETGLAVRAMMGLPTWATTVAGLLEGLVVPTETRLVVIFADKDRPRTQHEKGVGYSASAALAQRLREQGKTVAIYMPPFALPEDAKSVDWADVLEAYGLERARQMPFITSCRQAIARQLGAMGLTWESACAHH